MIKRKLHAANERRIILAVDLNTSRFTGPAEGEAFCCINCSYGFKTKQWTLGKSLIKRANLLQTKCPECNDTVSKFVRKQ